MDIRKPDRSALKSFFVRNAVPTESNFADLIDGMLNQKEDGIAKLAGEPLSIQADGNDTSQKKAINFYRNFADPKPAWIVSLNPRVNPNAPATARPGLSVGDADGNAKLFIDQTTGNVGIGTVEPGDARLNVNGSGLFTNYLFVLAENAGRLRVGAAWGMPGLYSSQDGPRPLTLGVAAGQRVYLGVGTGDAYVEGGTGHAYFKGRVGVGTPSPGETLEVAGRTKLGALTVGPWPANGGYMFFGVNTLDQGAGSNYALLQGAGSEPGRTFLNSPVDIRFRIANAEHMILAHDGEVGIGTNNPQGKLHVHTGGAGTWDRFVVKTTNLWGDGNTQYVTIGEGGAAGIMLYNPHVVWMPSEGRASIRLGRSGGVPTGHWWDIGVRRDNVFSILDGHNGAFGLSITEAGTVKVNVLQLGEKWRLSGVGDAHGNDGWLRLFDVKNTNYWGGLAAGQLFSIGGVVQGSDERLKANVTPLQDGADGLFRLRPVRFTWREASRDQPCLGLVAQEVEEVFPEVVSTGPDGMKGINYGLLVAPLIEAVKQQQAQIAGLRAEIEGLRAR